MSQFAALGAETWGLEIAPVYTTGRPSKTFFVVLIEGKRKLVTRKLSSSVIVFWARSACLDVCRFGHWSMEEA